ncbi:MAG TPA: hypothetical protein PLU95_06525 [Syntrophales bacterium]|nr:hypothetical protein [Syntrophales bacterium]HOD98195.1 hypothetical protein [Syntrophales bacterium]HPN08939.1 hypothetical protein [Syntrophales bacterium]HPX80589.1 hypothetical protein [Syntrophales bacterium]HQB14160.1 hypothetical protein [Syntrophales bacterium]
MNKYDLWQVTEAKPSAEAGDSKYAERINQRHVQPENTLRVLCVGRIHKGKRTVVIAFHRKPTPIVPDSPSPIEDESLDHGNDLHHERRE